MYCTIVDDDVAATFHSRIPAMTRRTPLMTVDSTAFLSFAACRRSVPISFATEAYAGNFSGDVRMPASRETME